MICGQYSIIWFSAKVPIAVCEELTVFIACVDCISSILGTAESLHCVLLLYSQVCVGAAYESLLQCSLPLAQIIIRVLGKQRENLRESPDLASIGRACSVIRVQLLRAAAADLLPLING